MYTNHGLRFLFISAIMAFAVLLPGLQCTPRKPGDEGYEAGRPSMAVGLVPFWERINYGMDLAGGAELKYRLPGIEGEQLDIAIDVIRKRLDIFGLKEIVLRKAGRSHFLIQLPGVGSEEVDRIQKVLARSGRLDFKLLVGEDEMAEAEQTRWIEDIRRQKEARTWTEDQDYDVGDFVERDRETREERSRRTVLLDNRLTVPGAYLGRVFPDRDDNGLPAVGFQFKEGAGSKLFGQLTGDNVGRRLAIVLDGEMASAPTIQGPIFGRGQITGDFTQEEVRDLLVVLQGGSLPARPELESRVAVGPGLGRASIQSGRWAMAVGFALVLGFMLVYYLEAGIAACLALAGNVLLVVSAMVVFQATLTLPGIAGVVLTVGMSVDANIIIFERIREELQNGKTIRQALTNGFDRAFWTIFDSNITTLLTGVILYYVGTGPIKGFAVTLSLGILTSMFTAIYCTRALLALAVARGWLSTLRTPLAFQVPSIEFVRLQRVFVPISAAATLGGLALFLGRGPEKYGIDFTGGALLQVGLRRPLTRQEVASRLAAHKDEYASVEVQEVGLLRAGRGEDEGGTDYQIRCRARVVPEKFPPHEAGTAVEGRSPLVFRAHLVVPEGEEPDLASLKAVLGAVPPEERASYGLSEDEGRAVFDAVTAQVGEAQGSFRLLTLGSGPLPAEAHERAAATYRGFLALTPAVRLADLLTIFKEDVTLVLGDDLAPGGLLGHEVVRSGGTDGGAAGEVRIRFRANLRAASGGELDAAAVTEALRSTPEAVRRAFADDVVRPAFAESTVELAAASEALGVYREAAVTTGVLPLGDLQAEEAAQALEAALEGSDRVRVAEAVARDDEIGQAVATDLLAKGILAMVCSLVAIIVYLTFRFEYNFGLGAVVALVHDVCIAAGALVAADLAGFDLKIDLPTVAAFLTIIGYSLNDTIVIFDRIRENTGLYRRMDYAEMVNLSINQSLSRTFYTSCTTLLVLFALMGCGVKVVQEFAYAMIVGVVVGTYSSSFVACPVLLWLRERDRRREERLRGATPSGTVAAQA
ncbi:MAG: protein translocase subunit SecD [Planctomycetes bacterium]|nr:protein translocase subunit SecD [Planctomycetota bacterium]